MRVRLVLALLLVVTVAGGALRFDAAAHPDRRQSKDEQSYAMLARSIIARHDYSHPGMQDPTHWPPGAPLLFAFAYRMDPQLRGDGVLDVPSAYRYQAAVGTVLILAVFWLGLVLGGPWAGLVAAAVTAFYPPLIRASGDLLSEPLGALCAVVALAAIATAVARRLAWPWLLLGGLACGATVLTRADLALLPILCVLVVGVAAWRTVRGDRRVSARRAVRAGVPVLVGTLVLLLPWTAYASHKAGRFVALSTGGESNFFVGTYLPGDGTMFGVKRALEDETKARFPYLTDTTWTKVRQRDIMRAVALRRPWLSEPDALRAAARHNLTEYALKDPFSFAGMMASKVKRLWGFYPIGTNGTREGWITAIHLAVLAFGVIGLIGGLAFGRRPLLWLLALPLLYVSLLNAILVSEARHNLTLMPVLITGGAAGFAALIARYRARTAREVPSAVPPASRARTAT